VVSVRAQAASAVLMSFFQLEARHVIPVLKEH